MDKSRTLYRQAWTVSLYINYKVALSNFDQPLTNEEEDEEETADDFSPLKYNKNWQPKARLQM